MKAVITIIVAAFGLVLTEAQDAMAWGPGMHLAAANHVLDNLQLITPFVGDLISSHRRAFLYGCLSADIFIGKGSTFRPGHSHNWETGFRLLETVTEPRLMSYAYGYLTHLAADTVAHNYYIPGLLAVSHVSGTASHVYFEMQADARTNWDSGEALELFRRKDSSADSLLLSATSHAKWMFKLKKRLMLGGLVLFGRKHWGGSLGLAERILPSLDYEEFLRRMTRRSLAAVVDTLNAPMSSPVVQFDPIGSKNLKRVRVMRSHVGRAKAKGLGSHFPMPDSLATLNCCPSGQGHILPQPHASYSANVG